jgi:hypothetical protein
MNVNITYINLNMSDILISCYYVSHLLLWKTIVVVEVTGHEGNPMIAMV